MLCVGLRLNVVNYIAGRFQLEPFPVCFLHQVEAVKGVLFIVPEEAACLKHTVWACCRETSQDLIGQQLSGAYTLFEEFRLLNGCSYET